jgi:hypothetical protein
MARQMLQDGPYIDPPIASGTALVATSAEPLWSSLAFSPIYANDPKAGKIYEVVAGGIITTAASGTLILTPGIGTTSPGTTLGASGAQTVPVSLTNVPWHLRFSLVFRVIDPLASTASTCIGTGVFWMGGTLATAGSGMSVAFGGTAATAVNVTVNNYLTIQKTLSVAGSVTTQYAYISSVN